MDLIKIMESDEEIVSLLHQVNKVMIDRMDYNDHGIVHSKIVSENALKILDLIDEEPNIIKEGIGNIEDVRNAIVIGAFLHDVGNAINRENHELLGMIIAQPIIDRLLRKLYSSESKITKLKTIINEEILCHMGNYIPTSIEAKIVAVADGTDITKGRARIAFKIGKKDIHEYSAMAIDKVKIKKGSEKPVEIHVYMQNPAGIFQVEEVLIKKRNRVGMEDKVKVIAHVGEEENEY
jgi:metal-dependent HD superfamily phosphatase/phosphodiesterase